MKVSFDQYELLAAHDNMQDFPPKSSLAELLPFHDSDFQRNVPMRHITSRRGWGNITAHYPENTGAAYKVLKPDLGMS